MRFTMRDLFDGLGILATILIFAALMLLSEPAAATWGKDEPPKVEVDVDVDVPVGVEVDTSLQANASAGASATNAANALGGRGEANNAGVANTSSTNVYALGLEFPHLVGCIGGGQGGLGDERGNSGFLGLNLLNVACWMQQLSEAEEDLEIRARLKCGDKHYRRAINLGDRTGTRGEEMQRCIGFVKPRWTAQLLEEKDAAEAAAAALQLDESEAARRIRFLEGEVGTLEASLREQQGACEAQKQALGAEHTEAVIEAREECFGRYGPKQKTK